MNNASGPEFETGSCVSCVNVVRKHRLERDNCPPDDRKECWNTKDPRIPDGVNLSSNHSNGQKVCRLSDAANGNLGRGQRHEKMFSAVAPRGVNWSRLGGGTYANVFVLNSEKFGRVAMKCYRKFNAMCIDALFLEILVRSLILDSTNLIIPRVWEWGVLRQTVHKLVPFAVMDYVPVMFRDILPRGKPDIHAFQQVSSSLLHALVTLHQNAIAHGDLKHDNVGWDTGRGCVVLFDFSNATVSGRADIVDATWKRLVNSVSEVTFCRVRVKNVLEESAQPQFYTPDIDCNYPYYLPHSLNPRTGPRCSFINDVYACGILTGQYLAGECIALQSKKGIGRIVKRLQENVEEWWPEAATVVRSFFSDWLCIQSTVPMTLASAMCRLNIVVHSISTTSGIEGSKDAS